MAGRRRALRLLLAATLVLAGCATPFTPTAETTAPATQTRATTETAVPTAATPAATSGENPWGTAPVVVAVRNEGSEPRNHAALVRAATDFWEDRNESYLGFPVRYDVRPDAAEPDLVITFTDRIPDCGGVGDAVGCAPYVTDPEGIQRPETVWVKAGLSADSATLVIQHELGHTLGLDHDDPPRDVMRASSVLYTEPQPDATERLFPWADGDFTVRVDAANASDPAGADRQVDRALTYYADGAPGMPDNLSFERTAGTDAEIRIRFGPTATCNAEGGSCVSTYGSDPDGDGAIETYSRVEITLVGLDTDAVGWHVGYWLAHAFGAEPDAEKPPPLRDASYGERRSAWWE